MKLHLPLLVSLLLTAACSAAPEDAANLPARGEAPRAELDKPASEDDDAAEAAPSLPRLSLALRNAEINSRLCATDIRPANATCRQIRFDGARVRDNARCEYRGPNQVIGEYYALVPACAGGAFGYGNGITLFNVDHVACENSRDYTPTYDDDEWAELTIITPGAPVLHVAGIYDFPAAGRVHATVRFEAPRGTLEAVIQVRDPVDGTWRDSDYPRVIGGVMDEVDGLVQPATEVRLEVRATTAFSGVHTATIYRARLYAPACIPGPNGCE